MKIGIFALGVLVVIGLAEVASANACRDGHQMGLGLAQKATANWNRYVDLTNEAKNAKNPSQAATCKAVRKLLPPLRQARNFYQQAWHTLESGLDSGGLFYCHDANKRTLLRSQANKMKRKFNQSGQDIQHYEATLKKHCR